MKRIGIVVLATNAYFVLGIRFIKRFMHFYKGDCEIVFYFFSDEDPHPCLPEDINIRYYHQQHTNWVDGTNSKFKNILGVQDALRSEVDYVYYFDADTSVDKNFTEAWFLGDLVGGEHYGNRNFLSGGKGFDRFELSKAYVPLDSPLPYTYHYGAFFGGTTENMITFCETMRYNQLEDRKIGYEPGVNDESYINQYFHVNPPTYTVPCEEFAFVISDKGGIGETRDMSLDISAHKEFLRKHRYDLVDVKSNVFSFTPIVKKKVLIMVMSSQLLLERRMGILESYGGRLKRFPNIELMFYSDDEDPDTNTVKIDAPFIMSYHDNEIKLIGAIDLIEQRYHNKYDWYFLIDDDTFVNIPLLDSMIDSFDEDYIHGQDITGQYGPLPYLSGGAGTLISNKIVSQLFGMNNYTTGFADVNLGMNIRDRGLSIQHSDLFHYSNPYADHNTANIQGYIDSHITSHRIDPETMKNFNNLVNYGQTNRISQ